MDKKGQSALEYLMTYGWALVVIVVVMAALFAFEIFSTPLQCSMTSGKMLLKDYTASTADGLTLVLQNGTGRGITGVSVVPSTLGTTLSANYDDSMASTDTNKFLLSGSLSTTINETVTITYVTAAPDSLTKTETTTCSGTVS